MEPSIRAQFRPDPGLTYLDTATYGLPPEQTLRVMRDATDAWQAGTAAWVEWDRQAERARAAFGRLVGTIESRVALLPSVSVGVGVVAADLDPGDRVVVPALEFRSVLYPLLVARERGIDLVEVEDVDRLIEAIVPGTALVALSLVQMQTGRVLPIREIVERAEAVGARVLLDATHGVPFVRLDDVIDRIDYIAVAAYKHLLCPRGVAFFVVREDHIGGCHLYPSRTGAPRTTRTCRSSDARSCSRPVPLATTCRSAGSAGWARPSRSSCSTPGSQRARSMSRSPWARSLAETLGIQWGGGTLVCPQIDDPEGVRAILADHRIKAAFRGTAVRFSTHVYNDQTHIERAAGAIAPLVAQQVGSA